MTANDNLYIGSSPKEYVPLHRLWIHLPKNNTFDITFPSDTLLSSTFNLAIVGIKTADKSNLLVGDQTVLDDYVSTTQPILPFCIPAQQIHVPAHSKMTCVGLSENTKPDPDICYCTGKFNYFGGMLYIKEDRP